MMFALMKNSTIILTSFFVNLSKSANFSGTRISELINFLISSEKISLIGE